MRNLLRLKIKTDYYRIFFRNGLFSGYDRHGSYHCTVCYAKGYTVKYLPHHVRLVDIHDPQKKAAALSTMRWYRKA